MAYRILMVDDNIKNLSATKGYLEANGFEVETTQSPEQALSWITDGEYALALLDVQMPTMSMNGDELAAKIREINPLQQVAMFSCDDSREALKRSHKAGALEFIEKNEKPENILAIVKLYCLRYETVCRTIRSTKNKGQNAEILKSFKIVGKSEAMGKVAHKIQKLGEASDISVFISGESGAGKELVARALHDSSSRHKGPFVAINCTAIPKDLLESELFGHVKGAFTGAIDKKDGRFVQANGGTVFLDEIADMPIDLQAKLLRVIQERIVDPVGSRFSTKIDVRIITASHRDLNERVKQGLFREDLKYRILVADIALPPLRDRVEDIELLVGHFTDVFNRRYKFKPARYFQRRTLEVLRRYAWPGNVRELMNEVEKHMVAADGPAINPESLDLRLYRGVAASAAGTATLEAFELQQGVDKQTFILETIETAGGSKAEAARRLGITPQNLQYLLGESKSAKTKKPQASHETEHQEQV